MIERLYKNLRKFFAEKGLKITTENNFNINVKFQKYMLIKNNLYIGEHISCIEPSNIYSHDLIRRMHETLN